MKIILGSASARRQKILRDMGYDFEIMPADIDEKTIRNSDPTKLTLALANAKMDALLARIKEDAILVTSDLVVFFEGKIIEKPLTKEEAYKTLDDYENNPIATVCSVCVINTKTDKRASGTDISTVHFNPIPQENIKHFIESGKVFEHAGSFAAENPLFTPYIKNIEGTLESIAGLPVDLTRKLINSVQ